MKIMRIIISIALAWCFTIVACCCQNDTDNIVISDLLLYEHDNGDFYIDVLFDYVDFNGTSSDKLVIKIINSRTFHTKDEPDPIYASTIKELEIEYSSLPLKEVSNEVRIIPDAPKSDKVWEPDGRIHDLYILDGKYMLFQYTEDNERNAPYGSKWWQPMYNDDRETQAEIIEYADYKTIVRYKFGPRYHATPEGQIQCIYKYGNCVYYRQIN